MTARRTCASWLLAMALISCSLIGARPAYAYWSVAATYGTPNYALAAASSLSAPTAPTATAASSSVMNVGWTLPGTQLAGAQYQVTRTAPSNATVCTVSSSTTSCQDTGLSPATSYSYSIAAVLSSWQSTAVTTTGTTSAPSYTISLSAASATAGTAITVLSITAKNGAVTDTTYTGTKTISWSGLATSPAPASQAPSYPSASVTFVAGVATPLSTFTAYASGSNTISAADAAVPAITGSATVTINPAAIHHFAVGAPASATAGVAFITVSLTARDLYDNTATSYAGTKTVTWTGPANSPGGQAPTLPPTSVAFTNGVSTTTLTATLVNAASTTLTATDATSKTGSATIAVTAAAVDHFAVGGPVVGTAGTQITGTTLSAHDFYDNTATTYTGSKTITWSGPTNSPSGQAPVLPATAVSFTSGNSTTALDATLYNAAGNTLTATDASISKSGSKVITVSAGIAATVAVVSGSNQTKTTSAAFANPLVASAKDTWANPVPSASVVFTAPAAGPSGTFAATGTRTTTVTANASGVATSSTLTANATAGGPYNVVATSGTGSVNFSLTNTAPLVVTSITSADTAGSTAHAEQGDTFSVTFNNPLNPATVATGTAQTITLVGSGSNTTVTMTGLSTATGFVVPSNYEKSGNTSSASGSIALSNGNKTITFTITSAFSNASNVKNGSSGVFTFTPLATIADLGGSTAGAFTIPSAITLW